VTEVQPTSRLLWKAQHDPHNELMGKALVIELR